MDTVTKSKAFSCPDSIKHAQTSVLKPLPPFINDKFALKLLMELGGQAKISQIKAHLTTTYDLSTFPHAFKYLCTQYTQLVGSYYLRVKNDKKMRDRELIIAEDARPIIEKMLSG